MNPLRGPPEFRFLFELGGAVRFFVWQLVCCHFVAAAWNGHSDTRCAPNRIWSCHTVERDSSRCCTRFYPADRDRVRRLARGLSVFHQPCHGFRSGPKRGEIAAGKTFHVLLKLLRNPLDSRARGLLDERLIKDSGFFYDPNCFRIKGCPREIGKRQD